MSSISTLAEIVFTGPPDMPAGPDAYPASEPYSELLHETLKAAEGTAAGPVDACSTESADQLFEELLDNWQ